MKKVFAVTAAMMLLGLSIVAQANITIETVAVGNSGNAADTTGYGAVAYDYNIGKYEVTAGQYTAFLNATAATDSYGLYSAKMWSDSYGCKIQQSGASGSYTYTVAAANANKPVNYVSWYDSLRFANWMTNGQGSGSTESGAYTISGGGIDSGTVGITSHSSTTAKWYVPTEDEWYKAAFFKNGSYSLYTNGTSTAPLKVSECNYGMIQAGWDGSTNGALEQNGTKDMNGNVNEWNESLIGSNRGVRGGSFYASTASSLISTFRGSRTPTTEDYHYGFRVTGVVPEPSSMMALAGGLIGLIGLRRRQSGK